MATSQRGTEEWTRRRNQESRGRYDFDALALGAEEHVGHDPVRPEPVRGAEGVDVGIEEPGAEDDRIAHRATVSATHEGTFTGVEPTDTTVEFAGTNISRVEDSERIEGYELRDAFGPLQRLGVVEPPGEQRDRE